MEDYKIDVIYVGYVGAIKELTNEIQGMTSDSLKDNAENIISAANAIIEIARSQKPLIDEKSKLDITHTV